MEELVGWCETFVLGGYSGKDDLLQRISSSKRFFMALSYSLFVYPLGTTDILTLVETLGYVSRGGHCYTHQAVKASVRAHVDQHDE
jgi:hypothetical protein